MRRVILFASICLFIFPLAAQDRDFTTLFPARITAVKAYDRYEVEFLDIFPSSLKEKTELHLIGITEVDAPEGEDFFLFREQMEDVSCYVMFDSMAGIMDDRGLAQGVILYAEDDDLFYGEDGDDDFTGTKETLYEFISISCRLIAEGIAIVDVNQKLSPHVQFFLDFTQARRNREIDKNE